MGLSPPELLKASHTLADFDCGKQALNGWLQSHAVANQTKGFTRVLVVHVEMRVIGFYGLAPTAIQPAMLSRGVRTGRHPDPIPAILLGQLAVDRNWAGQGVGSGLLKDAMQRVVAGAAAIGGRALIVRAIDADAERYWERCGFEQAKGDSSTFYRAIDDIASWIGQP